jgi:hypothetical protein
LIRDGHVLHIDARKDRAMTKRRFDDLLRLFASGRSRRATLAALASGAFGASSLALVDDADAKRKRRRKKKRKKCKGDAKKCGKKCIAATACCSSSDCGNGACVGNTCSCNSGFKKCNGACIPLNDCCGACPGDTVCENGECICPAECCSTEECSGDLVCVEGICLCPAANAINCDGDELCCDGNTEVCKLEKVGDEFVPSCQAGGCPPTDFCADRETEQFVCALDLERVCVCTSTADQIPGHVCVDAESLRPDPCEECETSSQCGTGRVCIADGPGCECGGVNFCVSLCPEVASNRARHSGGTSVDLDALEDGLGEAAPLHAVMLRPRSAHWRSHGD